ncbi:glycosyltransferase family 2 protein [Acidiphilium acidophilum]|uniref:glycosyltransferase family 2 protein n=1 Tax=Acidiphilium acidophilum TaxID=76588 RepID=UPI002E8E6D5D|nr:glycosyltransferase family 2 protein [Acidiphilium acidophilum]
MPKTVVVILHYNNISDTLRCLESVVPQLHDELSALLVDNGSTDFIEGECQRVFGSIPVPILHLVSNYGWAGGNNFGIKWALDRGSDLICLLNNDTIVTKGALDAMVAASGRYGPCLLHPVIEYENPVDGAQLDPQAWPNAESIPDHPDLYKMAFAYGACLLIPADVFRRVGLFDERFFLQLEETDFFERADRLHVPSVCYTGARIIHKESASFGGRSTPEKTYYITRNSLLLVIKSFIRPVVSTKFLKQLYWRIVAQANGEGYGSKYAVWLWLLSKSEHASATRNGIIDFLFCRFGRRRS